MKDNSSTSETSTHNSPLVSVIIPVYNGQETICRALDNVLNQSYHDREVIIIDDGSTDSSTELLGRYGSKIQLIEQKNAGTPSARNHGVKLARGEYIAFLDQDDFWVQEKLAIQVEILEKHPSVGLTFSNVETVNKQGEKLGFTMIPSHLRYAPSWHDLLTKGTPVLPSTVLARRELMLKVGEFDADLAGSGAYADRDLFLRLRELTDFHYVDLCLAYYYYNETHLQLYPTNLFLFARKYWSHPRLLVDIDGRLHNEFVNRCSEELSWMMRALLRAERYAVSSEVLQRLNGYHETLKSIFGDSYKQVSGCDSIDLTRYELNPTVSLLLALYLCRPDLQAHFPEVGSGDLSRLTDWATAMAKGAYVNDGDRSTLLPHITELERLRANRSQEVATPPAGTLASRLLRHFKRFNTQFR